MKNSLILNTAK